MVEVVKKSITASSSKEGEFETSISTSAPSSTFASPSPVSVLTPVFGRGGHSFVLLLAEAGDDLRTDQAGSADDNDLHGVPFFVDFSVRLMPT